MQRNNGKLERNLELQFVRFVRGCVGDACVWRGYANLMNSPLGTSLKLLIGKRSCFVELYIAIGSFHLLPFAIKDEN